jgi:integrase
MTLDALLDLYEESYQGLAPKTQGTRKSIAKAFRNTWKYGLDMQASKVTSGQLKLWLTSQRSRLRNSSYNEFVRFVRQMFQIALDHRVVAESPAAKLKGIKVEKPIRLTPSWDQFLAIVHEIRSQRFNAEAENTADLVEFMGRAGVGTAECANLRGEHVDLKKKEIILYRRKTDVGYVIPIYPQLQEFIDRLAKRGRIRTGQPVFEVKDPRKGLTAACKRLKYPHFSSRALRRCFITRAVELGVDFKTISAWQGHQDGGVLIARTYSHLRNEHALKMATKLKD